MRRAAPGLLAALLCPFLAATLAAEAGAVDLTGLKGLGGSAGTSLMVGDWEYREHARPRFNLEAIFKYGISPRWVLAAQAGYGWNSYTAEESWLVDTDLTNQLGFGREPLEKVSTISPFTAGMEYRFGTGDMVPFVGFGGGVYVTQVLFNRTVADDPRNGARHRHVDFGLYGRAGVEQFLSDVFAIEYDALYHFVFAENEERFPEPSSSDLATFGRDFKVYNGNMANIGIRIGLRYYWGGGL